jgi:hypothetical protein
MRDTYLRWAAVVARRASAINEHRRHDDRGEINSSVYWTGAMLLLAVGIAAVISGKASAFADSIDFGA